MQRYPPHSDSLTHIITAILNRLDLNQFQVFYNIQIITQIFGVCNFKVATALAKYLCLNLQLLGLQILYVVRCI